MFSAPSIAPDVVLVSVDSWRSLARTEQVALRAAAEASALTQRELWAEYRTEAIEAVTAAGSAINEVDDPAAFQALVEPVYAEHAARYGDLVERIRQVAAGRP